MAAIGRNMDRPVIVIPTDDLGAILVAEHATALDGRFLFPHQPSDLPRALASKEGLYRLCRELGVPCPEAVFPSSRDDLEAFLHAAVFPVVVKGAEGWLLPREAGVRSTAIAETPEEVVDIWRRLEGRSTTGLMVQEYIPRHSGQDWIFHGYCDANSECLVAFTGRKLRSYPPYAGPTTLGRCIDNPVLRHQAEELFKAVSYRGIMDLDYRLDLRDGQYKLLDFNPRVGAQFRLFVDEHGIDVVRALHLDLTERRVPPGGMVQGRGFVAEHYDLLASWGYHRSGDLTLRAWLRSLRGVREPAWFALDALAPFLMMGVRFALRGLERAAGRIGWRSPAGRRRPPYRVGRSLYAIRRSRICRKPRSGSTTKRGCS
jgi:D-aspartate ligase